METATEAAFRWLAKKELLEQAISLPVPVSIVYSTPDDYFRGDIEATSDPFDEDVPMCLDIQIEVRETSIVCLRHRLFNLLGQGVSWHEEKPRKSVALPFVPRSTLLRHRAQEPTPFFHGLERGVVKKGTVEVEVGEFMR